MTEEITVEKKGLMDLSLKECESCGIKMEHLKMGEMALAMPWDVVIKTVNYLAKSNILSWDTTFNTAVEMMGRFL